ncbi:hypothetical protein UMZ34_00390 [Halopseudomonas pachastrellae]|nr:hypothetical protein UMZ34_00390 [Halopseudomonas pachastrellae]
MRKLAYALLLCAATVQAQEPAAVTPPQLDEAQVAAIRAAVGNSGRTITNVTRDAYRNPEQTLTFFGVTPEQTVVEVWPGGGCTPRYWRRCCVTRARWSPRTLIRKATSAFSSARARSLKKSWQSTRSGTTRCS